MDSNGVREIAYGYCHCGCGERTKLARQTNSKLGYVKGEPLRYLLGHRNRKPVENYRVEDRGFETPCWIWLGSENEEQYGKTRDTPAHRYYYTKYVGPIPDEYVVHHRCKVKRCVNPNHLEAATLPQNASYAVPLMPITRRIMSAKLTKSFRFSELTQERLRKLAEKAELNQTAYLEQLLKREDEKTFKKNPK